MPKVMVDGPPDDLRGFIARERRQRSSYISSLVVDVLGLSAETTLAIGGYKHIKSFDANPHVLYGAVAALGVTIAATAPRLVRSAITNIEGIIETTRKIKDYERSLRAHTS